METWPIANVMLVNGEWGSYIKFSYNGRPVFLAPEQKLARGVFNTKILGLEAIFLGSEWEEDGLLPPIPNPHPEKPSNMFPLPGFTTDRRIVEIVARWHKQLYRDNNEIYGPFDVSGISGLGGVAA